MARRVAIIGASGQLGSDLVRGMHSHNALDLPGKVDFQVIELTHADLEICDTIVTRRVLTHLGPDFVVNMAAFHRVDNCEDDPERAFRVNAIAVANLANVCRDLDAVLVHISTDYVFGGDRTRCTPYTETDLPWPVNVYGVSKLSGEYFVRSLCPKYLIVRTSGLYGMAGSSSKGGNFVELMLRLAQEGKPIQVVNDQRLAPTYTMDLAGKMVDLMAGEHYGLYHVVNTGNCTWYDFAVAIFELAGQSPQLSATTTATFGARANRPRYSVLASKLLDSAGIRDLRGWPEALAAYMNTRSQRAVN